MAQLRHVDVDFAEILRFDCFDDAYARCGLVDEIDGVGIGIFVPDKRFINDADGKSLLPAVTLDYLFPSSQPAEIGFVRLDLG